MTPGTAFTGRLVTLVLVLTLSCIPAASCPAAEVASSLATVLGLRSAGYAPGDSLPGGVVISAEQVGPEAFLRGTPTAGETGRSFVARSLGPAVPVRTGFALLLLANGGRLSPELRAELPLPALEGPLLLPRPDLLGDPAVFLKDVTDLEVRHFDERVASAPFAELERRYRLLHDHLLPVVAPADSGEGTSARNPLKQVVFDFRLLSAYRGINDDLHGLLTAEVPDWEVAWRLRDELLAVEGQLSAALDDAHIVVKDSLVGRLEGYRSRFRRRLEDELVRRRRVLASALSRNDVEASRSTVQGILYELKPALRGILPGESERSLYADLGRLHERCVAPVTRERSLAFTNHFSRLAAVLAPPSNSDNYRLGFKISDVEFQFLKASGSLVLHTDCSGFIGRIYRELARMAGFDLSRFVVRDSGVIGSIFMIEPAVSSPVALGPPGRELEPLRQGDVFYSERTLRGELQRHVIFFDRLVAEGSAVRVSLWEASPGGVKHRVKDVPWLLKRVDLGASKRNGVYRLKEMDAIDAVLARRGLMF